MSKNSRRGWMAPPLPVLLAAVALTAGITALLSVQLKVPWPVSYLVGVNCATFFLYGYDKMASRRKFFRISERTLHLFAFAGGTPAAFLAQGVFRHKTVKSSFRTAFWLLAALQAGLVVGALWWFRK